MKKQLIIELAKDSKFLREGSESNGHGTFGESESYYYEYISINRDRQRIFDNYYIIHDGENPIKMDDIKMLGEAVATFLNPDLIEEYKERRREDYLELKKEFEG